MPSLIRVFTGRKSHFVGGLFVSFAVFRLIVFFVNICRRVPLPKGWKASIAEVDKKWIAKALCRYNPHGVLEVQPTQLWFHPPQPHLIPPPTIDRYFAHDLLVWMPKKFWSVELHCIRDDCNNRGLGRAGNYPVVRHVLNITSSYLMVTEILECGKCTSKYVGWSGAIVKQLDISRRGQFPVILTYRFVSFHIYKS